MNKRADVIWVPIEQVLPNPLNPRKNDAIRTEEMQGIIKKRGWEEPLIAYKKGKMFVLLAGHRRLYAAREARVKEIPLFEVEAPKTHQEEIERIASLQSGRVDWTPFEWAKFTYERWVAWGQPPMNSFAKEINLPSSAIVTYIKVLHYFPIYEIEAGLKNGSLTFTALDVLYHWMSALKSSHPAVVEALTEEMIRKVMVEKIELKLATRESMRRTSYLRKADDNQVKEFLLTRINLEIAMEKVNISMTKKTFHGSMVSINSLKSNVANLNPTTESEIEKAFESLKALKDSIDNKLKDIERKNPEKVREIQNSLW